MVESIHSTTDSTADSLKNRSKTELYWMIHDYFQRLDNDGHLLTDSQGAPLLEPMNTYPRIDPEDYQRNDQPDGVSHNYPTFHEFGNFTHPDQVLNRWRELRQGIGELCKHLEPQIVEQIQKHFATEIDGLDKGNLFEIAIIFHDIAKNISPMYPDDPKWPISLRKHEHHEDIGADFLRTYKPVRELLMGQYNLTEPQIDYIADCVGNHFVLDQARRERIEQKLPYDFTFTQSQECQDICGELIEQHTNMAVEIGVFFLVDSAGKTTEYHVDETEQSYQEYLAQLRQRVLQGEVEFRLERALSQQTLNFQVGKAYMTHPSMQF